MSKLPSRVFAFSILYPPPRYPVALYSNCEEQELLQLLGYKIYDKGWVYKLIACWAHLSWDFSLVCKVSTSWWPTLKT